MVAIAAALVVLAGAGGFLVGRSTAEDSAAPAHEDASGGPLVTDQDPLSDEFTLTGSLEAPECGGGFDIEGSPVTVRDETDTVIGSATTSQFGITTPGKCKVTFTIEALPRATFYQIEIGTHGGPSYSFEELVGLDWDLVLTLGD